MKKKLFILSLLSLIFIFASCEKNDNDVNNSKPKNPEDLYAKTEYNKIIQYYYVVEYFYNSIMRYCAGN